MTPHLEYDQTRFPLATLLIVAEQRNPEQRIKRIALARRIARERGIEL